MLLFDIGANRGDATVAGLELGFKVIALEPAPKIFSQLVNNHIYNPNVIPLRLAVSDKDNERLEFYEADEDGLSTLNKGWLTDSTLPYAGKSFRTIGVNTITVDTLVKLYGRPDLMKIDVEGAEWSVFRGMTKHYGTLTFEWTLETLDEHQEQLNYLKSLGYNSINLRFIEEHLKHPRDGWVRIGADMSKLRDKLAPEWENGGWKESGLRPTADVGMLWVS